MVQITHPPEICCVLSLERKHCDFLFCHLFIPHKNKFNFISVSTFFEGQQIGVCRGSFYWRRNRGSRSIELLDKRTKMVRNCLVKTLWEGQAQEQAFGVMSRSNLSQGRNGPFPLWEYGRTQFRYPISCKLLRIHTLSTSYTAFARSSSMQG